MSILEIAISIAEYSLEILTTFTVLFLYYYTKETYLLRKEAEKQTQVQFTPYLALRNMEEGAAFANLGKGIARDVRVDDSIKIRSNSILLIPSIGAGEDRKIYQMSKDGNGAFSVHAYELPDVVAITYFDTSGKKYFARFEKEYKGMGVYKEVEQRKIEL
jgi:hypothetical protein